MNPLRPDSPDDAALFVGLFVGFVFGCLLGGVIVFISQGGFGHGQG